MTPLTYAWIPIPQNGVVLLSFNSLPSSYHIYQSHHIIKSKRWVCLRVIKLPISQREYHMVILMDRCGWTVDVWFPSITQPTHLPLLHKAKSEKKGNWIFDHEKEIILNLSLNFLSMFGLTYRIRPFKRKFFKRIIFKKIIFKRSIYI